MTSGTLPTLAEDDDHFGDLRPILDGDLASFVAEQDRHRSLTVVREAGDRDLVAEGRRWLDKVRADAATVDACTAIRRAVERWADGSRDGQLRGVLAVVRLDERGHRGLAAALDELWQVRAKDGRDFWRLVEFARGRVLAAPSAPADMGCRCLQPFDLEDLIHPDHRPGAPERLGQASPESPQPATTGGSGDIGDASPKRWESDPRPLPSLLPLPLDALGPLLGDVAAAVAEHYQVPSDLVVNLALPVITAAAGGSWVVRIREGWDETLALATLTVAGSGERKSPALRALDSPLRAHEQALRRAAATESALREVEREVAGKKVDDLRRQLADSLEDGAVRSAYAAAVDELNALPDDVTPRWLIDDATPEVLAKRLAEHGGLGVISAEPTLFGILLGRYSGGVPNVELYLKATSGDPVSVDRIGRDTLYVDHPCLSIGVCIQPGRLAKLGREDRNGTGTVLRDSGMLARFLYAYPGTLLGRRTTGRPMPRDLADRWRLALVALADASRRHPVGKPTTLPFALDADALLDVYAAQLEPRLDPDTGDLADMADWAAKLVGTCARIAGALTLLDDPDAQVIPASAVTDALRLGDAYISHAARALSTATVGADSATEAAQVLTWLRKHGAATFTRRDIWQGLRGRKWLASADMLDGPLAMLDAYGHIRAVEVERSGPGRPSETYELHPANLTE